MLLFIISLSLTLYLFGQFRTILENTHIRTQPIRMSRGRTGYDVTQGGNSIFFNYFFFIKVLSFTLWSMGKQVFSSLLYFHFVVFTSVPLVATGKIGAWPCWQLGIQFT